MQVIGTARVITSKIFISVDQRAEIIGISIVWIYHIFLEKLIRKLLRMNISKVRFNDTNQIFKKFINIDESWTYSYTSKMKTQSKERATKNAKTVPSNEKATVMEIVLFIDYLDRVKQNKNISFINWKHKLRKTIPFEGE